MNKTKSTLHWSNRDKNRYEHIRLVAGHHNASIGKIYPLFCTHIVHVDKVFSETISFSYSQIKHEHSLWRSTKVSSIAAMFTPDDFVHSLTEAVAVALQSLHTNTSHEKFSLGIFHKDSLRQVLICEIWLFVSLEGCTKWKPQFVDWFYVPKFGILLLSAECWPWTKRSEYQIHLFKWSLVPALDKH